MSALDHIKWSVMDYDMKDFVELFSHCLPVLCQTTTGYSGCDEDIHQIGADEIYFIYEILRQPKIVARDSEGRFISIPVENCKYKFQIVDDDNKRCSMVTPASLLEKLKQNTSENVRFMFEKDRVVSYQIGADVGHPTKFGVLKLQEFYEEKYLLGFGMHNGVLFRRTVGIPVYMDISFSRAMGFDEDEKGGRRFQQWTQELKTLVGFLEKTSIKTCQEIILFTERPSNGDYEYIRPSNFIVDSLKKSNKTAPPTANEDANTGNEYSYVISRELASQFQGQEQLSEKEHPVNITRSHSLEVSVVELPPMPRRRPPTPPLPAKTRSDDRVIGEVVTLTTQPETDDRPPPAVPSRQAAKGRVKYDIPRRMIDRPPPPTEEHEYQNEDTRQVAKIRAEDRNEKDNDDSEDIDYEDVLTICDSSAKSKCTETGISSNESSLLAVNSENPSSCSSALSSSDVVPGDSGLVSSVAGDDSVCRLSAFDSPAKVPCDEDVTKWAVGDVANLLRLLKMSQYCDVFQEQQIDGCLLLSLDEKTLINDFGFRQFEATKITMFIHKGWRPK